MLRALVGDEVVSCEGDVLWCWCVLLQEKSSSCLLSYHITSAKIWHIGFYLACALAEGTWCSGITSASHAEGPGFKSQCVHSLGRNKNANPQDTSMEDSRRSQHLTQEASQKHLTIIAIYIPIGHMV